jgi:uncharacterized protein (TIGR02145 family)
MKKIPFLISSVCALFFTGCQIDTIERPAPLIQFVDTKDPNAYEFISDTTVKGLFSASIKCEFMAVAGIKEYRITLDDSLVGSETFEKTSLLHNFLGLCYIDFDTTQDDTFHYWSSVTDWLDQTTTTGLTVYYIKKPRVIDKCIVTYNPDKTYGSVYNAGGGYKTIAIGSQTWTAENLKVSTSSIDPFGWAGASTYCGKLYNWKNAALFIPPLYQVPSKADWETLIAAVGGMSAAGGALKEVDTVHWKSPNTGATNSSGFTALAAGYSITKADSHSVLFDSYERCAMFWTSTTDPSDTAKAFALKIDYNTSGVSFVSLDKSSSCSVRFVKIPTIEKVNVFSFPGTSPADFSNVMTGTVIDNTGFTLTSSQPDKNGAFIYSYPVWFSSGFETTFSFVIDSAGGVTDPHNNNGGDGFAFFIINDFNQLQDIRSNLGGLGYSVLTTSTIVEFDTYYNPENHDIEGNHVAVMLNGDIDHANSPASAGPIGAIDNGSVHTARITCQSGVLSVFVDGSATPACTANVFIEIGNEPYVGFTSSTAAAFERHKITAWSFYRF